MTSRQSRVYIRQPDEVSEDRQEMSNPRNPIYRCLCTDINRQWCVFIADEALQEHQEMKILLQLTHLNGKH
jgi:hypothetical protein